MRFVLLSLCIAISVSSCAAKPPPTTLCSSYWTDKVWDCVDENDQEYSLPYAKIGEKEKWISIPLEDYKTLLAWWRSRCEKNDSNPILGDIDYSGLFGGDRWDIIRLLKFSNEGTK